MGFLSGIQSTHTNGPTPMQATFLLHFEVTLRMATIFFFRIFCTFLNTYTWSLFCAVKASGAHNAIIPSTIKVRKHTHCISVSSRSELVRMFCGDSHCDAEIIRRPYFAVGDGQGTNDCDGRAGRLSKSTQNMLYCKFLLCKSSQFSIHECHEIFFAQGFKMTQKGSAHKHIHYTFSPYCAAHSKFSKIEVEGLVYSPSFLDPRRLWHMAQFFFKGEGV